MIVAATMMIVPTLKDCHNQRWCLNVMILSVMNHSMMNYLMITITMEVVRMKMIIIPKLVILVEDYHNQGLSSFYIMHLGSNIIEVVPSIHLHEIHDLLFHDLPIDHFFFLTSNFIIFVSPFLGSPLQASSSFIIYKSIPIVLDTSGIPFGSVPFLVVFHLMLLMMIRSDIIYYLQLLIQMIHLDRP